MSLRLPLFPLPSSFRLPPSPTSHGIAGGFLSTLFEAFVFVFSVFLSRNAPIMRRRRPPVSECMCVCILRACSAHIFFLSALQQFPFWPQDTGHRTQALARPATPHLAPVFVIIFRCFQHFNLIPSPASGSSHPPPRTPPAFHDFFVAGRGNPTRESICKDAEELSRGAFV